jgi:dihydroneopterin aldolase
LLETLAGKILDVCFENPAVQNGELKIEKPNIFADIEAVGITMVRSRD